VGYTTERIEETLGGGRISFAPADLAVHERRLEPDDPFSALARLFLLGSDLSEPEAEAALGDPEPLVRTGWLDPSSGRVRATLKLVPHGDLLIASDRDDGPMGSDWVAGIHPPSVTLAKLTAPSGRTRGDTGTGNGVQALLAARHAEAVVDRREPARARDRATERRPERRGRPGSRRELLRARRGERFDLVTCNPPYVISRTATPTETAACRGHRSRAASSSRRQRERAALRTSGGWAHPQRLVGPLEPWVEGRGCDGGCSTSAATTR
jgi:hypothetical protein